ncbi:MAG: FadR/GntR family transcriptional regulator [Desulfitobacteriia bacterium]|jgi:GntR family transcriptional repressor for pyruvate dehydrogenase complex
MSVELKPIKTKKIYEEIVEQIKQLVIEGQIKPGDKLPSERHLVESFKVSRASIREALSALEMMGLLEVRTGEGAYIRQPQNDSMAVSLTWALTMEKGSVLELLEVRRMIEVQAVGYAAERATAEELAELESTLNTMKANLFNTGLKGEKADHAFHYKIAKVTHNRIIIRLMDTISDHLQHLIRVSRAKLYEGKYTPEILYEEHLRIYLALKDRDAKEARKQMRHHLQGVEEEILKAFN